MIPIITRTSLMSGTFSSTTSFLERNVAHKIARGSILGAANPYPAAEGLPPAITILSIKVLLKRLFTTIN